LKNPNAPAWLKKIDTYAQRVCNMPIALDRCRTFPSISLISCGTGAQLAVHNVMDGLDASQQIRQWEAEQVKSHLSIIALTANAYEEDRNHCLAAGMDDFLTKPLDIRKLEGMLLRHLS
jgi:CheY-like chemotaxis protein